MSDDAVQNAINALAARVTRLEDHRVADVREGDMRYAETSRTLADIRSLITTEREERKQVDESRVSKLDSIENILGEVRINTAFRQGAIDQNIKMRGALFTLALTIVGGTIGLCAQ